MEKLWQDHDDDDDEMEENGEVKAMAIQRDRRQKY